jgi:peptidoglycan/LPS O-acetylase OafA/YrhL
MKPKWHFTATPRELQFFVVGIALGIAAFFGALVGNFPPGLAIVLIALPIAFLILAVARDVNNWRQ